MWDVVASLLLAGFVLAPVDGDRLGGSVGTVVASRLRSDAPLTETGFILRGTYSRDHSAYSVRAEARMRASIPGVSHWNSGPGRDAYGPTLDWRELYVSTRVAGWNVAAGYQQVVWGRADNLRILDRVNPIDLREFVLPDLGEVRKPVPMLRVTRSVGEWELEAVYLPFFEPTSFAVNQSEFAFPLISADLLANALLLPEKRPARKVSNGEVGVQLSRSVGGIDLSLSGFATRSDNPVLRRQLVVDPLGRWALGLQPEYPRVLVLGSGLSAPVAPTTILRAEVTYEPDAMHMIDNDADGLERHPMTTAMLGVDYTYRDWLITGQVSDRHISSWDPRFVDSEHSPIVTLAAQGTTGRGKRESRVALSWLPQNSGGALMQFRTVYKPTDHWGIAAYLDLFWGDRHGLFGQFSDRDRVKLEVTYRL
jgi:hypothetical protein